MGTELADALYPLIGATADGQVKGKLVALRRSLHRGRVPGDGEWNRDVATTLPDQIGERIQRWIGERHAVDRDRADIGSVLADELPGKLDDLRHAASAPLFRHAMVQASRTLAQDLDKWLADDTRKPKRTTLFRLARYLSRAATKTSPYSTFMSTAPGVFSAQAGPAAHSVTSSATVLELDRALLGKIRDAIVRRWDLRSRLPVRVNPSVLAQDGTLRFLWPKLGEPIVTLDESPAILACLDIVRERTDRTLGELVAALADQAGDAGRAETFVDRLVENGFVELLSPVPDDALRPIDGLLEWFGEEIGNDPEFDRLASAMTTLSGALNRAVPPDGVDEHAARVLEVHDAVRRLVADLVPDHRDDGPRKMTFHENGVHTGAPVSLPADGWQAGIADLDVACRWLAVQDWTLPLRLALGAFTGAVFGAGAEVPLLTLHQKVQQAVSGEQPANPGTAGITAALADFLRVWTPGGAALDEHRGLDAVGELAELRAEATALLHAHADERTGDIVLPRDVLARAMRRWPAWLTPAASLACYVQHAERDGRALLAVNTVGPGHGRERARLTRLLASADVPVPRQDPPTRDALVAELAGTFGTAMNLRLPVCDYEIDYPGATSARPGTQRIGVHDLVARHEPETGLVRLHSRSLGREVVPAHLGMMVDSFLPALARFLVHGFGRTYLVHPQRRLPLLGRTGAVPGQVRRRPMVRVGDVVLQRGGWVVAPDVLPVRQPGVDDAEHLIAVHRWLREHGIPERVYVWIVRDYANHADRVSTKNRKPLFVDFANWFLVMTFERLVADGEHTVLLEEALPDPGRPADAATHVTELVLELNR